MVEKKTGNIRKNVTLRLLSVTTVAAEKTVTLTHPQHVSATLGVPHAMPMHPTILSSVARLPLRYLSTFSTQRYDFRKINSFEHKICVGYYLQLLYETFFILRRSQRYIVIHVYRSSCKLPVIVFAFGKALIFLTYFRKISKYKMSRTSVHWLSVGRTDRQT